MGRWYCKAARSRTNSASVIGGIYNGRSATLDITGTAITSNHATVGAGGGLWNEGGTVTMTSCAVTGNTAASHAGGILNTADWFLDQNGQPTHFDGTLDLSLCTVSNNTASGGNGGGIVNAYPGDPSDWALVSNDPYPATMTISDSTLNGNTAGLKGGAVAVFGGTVNDPIDILFAQVTALNLNSGAVNSLTSKLQAASGRWGATTSRRRSTYLTLS